MINGTRDKRRDAFIAALEDEEVEKLRKAGVSKVYLRVSLPCRDGPEDNENDILVE